MSRTMLLPIMTLLALMVGFLPAAQASEQAKPGQLGADTAVTVAVPPSMRAAPFDVPRALNVPSGYTISVYARIPSARFMAVAPNGDLLVSQPNSGKVLLVRPQAGGDPLISDFVSGLRRPHDVVFHTIGSTTYIYIAETNQINRYTYTAGDTTGQNRQVVLSGLPDSSLAELKGAYGHELKNIALDSNHKLYVSIASATNADPSDLAGEPKRGAVYVYDADGTNGRLWAQGIRNAEGLDILPGSNDLWVVVNNRDNIAYPFQNDWDGDGSNDYGKVMQSYVDNHPPEEFTVVRDGGNYGWPFCNPNPDTAAGYNAMPFTRDVQTNGDGSKLDCAAADRITQGIQAHSAPLGFSFLQDSNVPAPYRNGAAIAYHGCWNCSAYNGHKVTFFPWQADGTPGDEVDLVSGWVTNAASKQRWGRPVDVVPAPDGSLFISDDYAGAIYRLAPAAPPASDLRAPENPSGTQPGLRYGYYEGANWSALPNFASLAPAKQGVASGFGLGERTRDDDFAFAYTGYVAVPADGQYTFATTSDDGSRLLIGEQVVVDNDGLHAARERSGTIGLRQGLHALRVEFFERGGQELLDVTWSGPGFGTTALPASALAHVPASAGGPVISGLTLINADTDQPLGALQDGQTLSFAALGTNKLSVRADTSPATVGSVTFTLDGTLIQTENYAPYAIAGDNGADYKPWTPGVGTHTLTITPYTKARGAGQAGTPLTISFTVTS